ncbi:uncharacterized protein LOC105800930 [Gossypium raimondii]|uniref:uncharacterized protein LOC105800930 n=1 Tax=Gossypium raimondii TaxID=29730 RepID=UPI00227AA459|nr:uncharacterized protein LOC105800930 [Gossypium raimondii]
MGQWDKDYQIFALSNEEWRNVAILCKFLKTARANRKETKLQKNQSAVVGTQSNPLPEIEVDDEVESRVNENPARTLESEKVEVGSPKEVLNARVNENPNLAHQPMAQTIRQLAKAPIEQPPLCLAYHTVDTDFELKSGLIQLLPTFHGLQNENPHKHLKEFHMVCPSMKTQGVTEDQIKLCAFPFSIADSAKEWLFYLSPGSITTWANLSCLFLNRFFPTSQAAELRREIIGIRQKEAESLYDYWEQFKKLCASCPQHGMTEKSLLQYFYEGLKPMEMNMVDATSGGALVNMTPQQTRDLISMMAANSQQFRANTKPPRRVHQLSNSTLEDKVDRLTNMMNSLLAEKAKTARLCGICATPDHATDACPSLYDDTMAHLDAVGNFPGLPERRYDPYANTYNPRWRDHPNLSYGANPRNNQPYQNRKLLISKKRRRIPASTRELTTSIEKLTSQGKLSSQTEPNPRQNVNAVTLRSGKVLEPIPDRNLGQEIAQEKLEKDEKVRPKPPLSKIQPPFPERFNQCRRDKKDKEILETFRNVEINIPLLDAIKQIPQYAKFLKELCTNKRKLIGNERVNVGENVSAVLQQKMSTKCKDRGMFAIPCKIGHLGIKKAMCDLGASINVMPYSIYESLSTGFLTKTGVIIQLVNKSIMHPEGVLEDVLVKVNELIFPVDFYVIKMEEDNTPGSSNLLLGRPFLSTANTKIVVRSGTLMMEFNGEIVKFNVYDAISHPSEILSEPKLEKIRNDAYENARIYKDKTKLFHDKRITQKHFSIKQSENAKKTVEQRLQRIEARLETFGQQLIELIAIICDRQ